jgi:hypothetical protein
MISNFRRVLNVVCFLLGNSPVSEFYMPMFRTHRTHSYIVTLLLAQAIFEPSLFSPVNTPTFLKRILHQSAYEDGTECSETSAYKIQTPGNYSEESIQHL